jgi:acyl carrier protein
MNAQTTDTLQEIFRAVFELPKGANIAGVRQLNTPAWDSIAHVALVTAIESEFDISLDAGDQLRMTSYSSTALLLEERGL